MSEQDWLAQRFEEHRRRLRAVAYRMLGSVSEADDAVQEAWLRLSGSEPGEIENLSGWLTTVVARVSLNMLRSRAVRREEPLSPRLPDPIVDRADGVDPEHEALLADSVGLALLVVLETLTPPERLAFVLHDMFGVPFEEIAPLIDRSPQAARQLASRARRRVRARPTTPDVDVSAQREIVGAFLAAARGGDFDALVATLDPDVVLRADGGAALAAASAEVRGAARWRDRRSCGRASTSSCTRPWSTAPPAWSRPATAWCSRSPRSSSATGRSPRWTSSPTRNGSPGST